LTPSTRSFAASVHCPSGPRSGSRQHRSRTGKDLTPDRDTLRGVAIAAIANVVLGLVLIPLFGLQGAALATAATLIIWNLLLRQAVWRRIRIETMAFSLPFQRLPG